MKSPESERLRGKGCVPVFDTVAVSVLAEVPVTITALGKSRVAGVTTRFGFAVVPPIPG
jgi:hypothetical protein